MIIQTQPVEQFDDARGALIRAWPQGVSGEVYVVELRPGAPRGNHLHRAGGEWFIALIGRPWLEVVDPASGARQRLSLRGLRARVPAGIAHALGVEDDGPAWVLAVTDRPHAALETQPFRVVEP